MERNRYGKDKTRATDKARSGPMLAAVIDAAESILRGRTAEQTRAALIRAAKHGGCEYLHQLDSLRAKITP